jgi:hypothetical protein|mmetsp:Transcript_32639/g.66557  ORF Transcript_32639/g.66557 Transcript_32639/m.66557 type:complete len:82 (+) Transcript_32639:278-523(+)
MGCGYRIDALVEVNGNQVGIEVDGPSHFISSSKSPTGSTILKRRQVPSVDGMKLVFVPYGNGKISGTIKRKSKNIFGSCLV